MLFRWSLLSVAFGIFHLVASHQSDDETSLVVEKTVQQIVDEWKLLLKNKPKLGLPICIPTAYDDMQIWYGPSFQVVALVLDGCDPSVSGFVSTHHACGLRYRALIKSAKALYKSKDSTPFEIKAKEIIAQLSGTNDLEEQEYWAQTVLVKLARPVPKKGGKLEWPGIKPWSAPSNEASGLATEDTQSHNRNQSKRKFSEVEPDVVSLKVPKIDNCYGKGSEQSLSTFISRSNTRPIGSSTRTDVRDGHFCGDSWNTYSHQEQGTTTADKPNDDILNTRLISPSAGRSTSKSAASRSKMLAIPVTGGGSIWPQEKLGSSKRKSTSLGMGQTAQQQYPQKKATSLPKNASPEAQIQKAQKSSSARS